MSLSRENSPRKYDPRNSSKSRMGERSSVNSKTNLKRAGSKTSLNGKKKKRNNSRGIPSGSRQMSYFDQPSGKKRKRGRKSRNSSAASRVSGGEPDGTWSNARMLRYFVKQTVKERQGTENDLELGMFNRSLSQASLRIFNDIREKEHTNNKNSPMRISMGRKTSDKNFRAGVDSLN